MSKPAQKTKRNRATGSAAGATAARPISIGQGTMRREISQFKLPNGLRILCEPMPHVRSVSIGIWLDAGSRREPPTKNGMAHFIEHMVFKGTERRTAEQIAREMDSVGGLLDAFTSKEQVCFNAKVLDEHLPLAFDVLSDMMLRPLFTSNDIDKERQVILEEIRMEEDNPESVVHEVLTENFWRGHPLGSPILGTRATVAQFSRASLLECFRPWYVPDRMLVTAAGAVQPQALHEMVAAAFGNLKSTKGPHKSRAASRPPEPHARLIARDKPSLEQAHITIAVPSYPLTHPERFAVSLLSNILGGGMSSRLFQNIRERQGLAYAVFSEVNPYSDAGMLAVYAGTARQNVERVLRLVADEFRKLKQEPVTVEELRRAKDQMKGSLLLSLESTGTRMSNLARQQMYFGRLFTVEELLASLEKVTREDLQRIARDFFQPEKIAATILGPLGSFRLRRSLLAC